MDFQGISQEVHAPDRSPNAIEIRDLVKVYHAGSSHPVKALDGLGLTVRRGEIFGLLGRNGAGKTTLLRILTTLVQPTSGSVSVLGMDVVRRPYDVRKQICVVLQENSVELYLNVRDNLDTFARFHGIRGQEAARRIEEAIARFGLEEYRSQKVIDLSGGAKRRVQVAKAFMIDTPLLFLDEPTTGMDPITKRATLDAIREQAAAGRTVFLTTHILQEAEELCSSIALIDRGRIVAQGDLATITSLVSDAVDVSITFRRLNDEVVQTLRALPVLRFQQHHDTVEFSIPGGDFALLETIGKLAVRYPVAALDVHGATLEDAYIELLGKKDGETPS